MNESVFLSIIFYCHYGYSQLDENNIILLLENAIKLELIDLIEQILDYLFKKAEPTTLYKLFEYIQNHETDLVNDIKRKLYIIIGKRVNDLLNPCIFFLLF